MRDKIADICECYVLLDNQTQAYISKLVMSLRVKIKIYLNSEALFKNSFKSSSLEFLSH